MNDSRLQRASAELLAMARIYMERGKLKNAAQLMRLVNDIDGPSSNEHTESGSTSKPSFNTCHQNYEKPFH